MPRTQDDDRSHTNISLVKKYLDDKFTLEVAELEHLARVREAIEKKSLSAVLSKELENSESVAQSKKKKIKEVLNAELERLYEERKAGRLNVADYQSARERANDEYAAECDRIEKNLAQKRKTLNKKILDQKKNDEKLVQSLASSYAEQQYNKLTVYHRAEIQSKKAVLAAEEKERAKIEYSALSDTLDRLEAEKKVGKKTKNELKLIEEQISKVKEEQVEAAKTVSAAEEAENAARKESAALEKVILNAKLEQVKKGNIHALDLLNEVSSQIDKKKQEISDIHVQIQSNQKLGIDTTSLEKKLSELTEDIGNIDVGGSLEHLKSILEEQSHKEKLSSIKNRSVKDSAKDISRSREIEKAETEQQVKAQWAYFLSKDSRNDELGKTLANSVDKLSSIINDSLNQIDSNITSYYKYQSSIEARLQGSDESYKKSLSNISKNIGISGLVRQKDVIENLKKLTDSGIAYNLDLRAFLATISDDIANTFDVFDSNLMRLIRLQQSDTTVARLGMEASLTRLFNEFFSDTSYLTDAADSVSQSLIDANSQLTKDMSVEFEYMVQKWLGALYSLGMDSRTVSTIAQGLNYLGTGNVESLNSNSALQSLLAMSASRAGISYADILTGGLDADTTNSLMKSMIEYLKSIAENTDNNQVTKSAYSNVFGFSISDLTAVSSLTTQDIDNLYKQSLDYKGAVDEYTYQANQIINRTHFSQMLSTVFDNAMMTASTAIGNTALYGVWKVLNVVEDLTGGIAIPAISVMGNSVDLHQTVTGLAKTGIAGLGLMGSLLGSLFSGSMFGTMDYTKWGYDEFTSRGSATKGISRGTAIGTSESSSMNMIGSSSTSDVKSTALSDATDDADEDSKITNKNVEENSDIYEKIYSAIATEDTTVLQELLKLQTVTSDGTTSITNTMLRILDPSRIFYTAVVSMLPLGTGSSSVLDNSFLSSINTNIHDMSTDMSDVELSSTSDTIASTKIESLNSDVNVQHIANLMAQTSLGVSDSNSKSNNQLVTNDGLKVSINQMSPEVSSYIESTIRSVMISALTGGGSSSDKDSDDTSLTQMLLRLVQNNTFNVNVTNDNFDTALQKTMFMN